MDEKAMKKEYWNEVLTAALVLGLISAGAIALGYVLKDSESKLTSTLLFIIQYGAIIWVLVKYGKRVAKQQRYRKTGFSYGAAFGFSLLVLMISGILMGACQWFVQNVVDPAYYTEFYRKSMEKALSNSSLQESQIEIIRRVQSAMTSIWAMVISSMVSMAVVGGLFALVTSMFVKRPANPFAEDDKQPENQ